jgi:hypothetical protein
MERYTGFPLEMYLMCLVIQAAIGVIYDESPKIDCYDALGVNLKTAVAGAVEDSSANLCSGSDDTEAVRCKARLEEVAMQVGVVYEMVADD